MPDNFGRMTREEARASGLEQVLYGGDCWSCGATAKPGSTVCGDGFCAGKGRKIERKRRSTK